jgi:non-ribosomal peptide synthetase component F
MTEVLAKVGGSGDAAFSRHTEQQIEWLRPVRADAGENDRVPAKAMPDEIVETPLFETFQSIAAQHSERIAADDGQLRLTYGQMLQAAERLAGRLAGVREEGAIGVLLSTSAWFPVAMLACLAARRMVVPIDLHYPSARNAAIIRDAHLAGVIIRGEDGLQALSIPDNVRRVDIANIPPASSSDDDARPFLPDRDGRPGLPVDAPALVLYTSGSTGAPKGIVNNQRAILQRVLQHVNASRIGIRDGLLPLSSPCTVAGVREIFAALLTGATLHLLDPQRAGLNGIRRAIRENGSPSVTRCRRCFVLC